MTTQTENHLAQQLTLLPDTAKPTLYEGEGWGACLCLDQDGRVYTDTFRRNDGTPASIWHGRTRTWEVPNAVKACVLKNLLLGPSTLKLLARVSEGLSWDYDASTNRVGLLTEDAAEAEEALEHILSSLSTREGDGDCVALWCCRDWYANSCIADLWPNDTTLDEVVGTLLEDTVQQDAWLIDAEDLPDVLIEMVLGAYERGEIKCLSSEQRLAVLADAACAERLATFEED
jgi:hypothetical protein